MHTSTLRIVQAGLLAAGTLLAHYTWVAPVTASLEVGKSATVRISHGHKFPQSEEAISAKQVELFVLSPSGAKTKLEPLAATGAVNASFVPKEEGVHRIVMLQDRVVSRTPKGVRPGGRDKNPDASQSYRAVRSAVGYAATGKGAASGIKPAGLEFELAGENKGGAWHLQLLKQGKAVSGVEVEAFLSGSAQHVPAGKTDASGRLVYKPAAAGPAMFSAEVKDPAPSGAAFDSVNYSTSLYVSW